MLTKFCTNCRHYKFVSGFCALSRRSYVDPVTGKVVDTFGMAVFERMSTKSACGISGESFQHQRSGFVRFLNRNPNALAVAAVLPIVGGCFSLISDLRL